MRSLTLAAWKGAGGSYVLSGNEARSASPELHDTSEGTLVLLPRLLKDDYTVIVRDITLRSEHLTDAFLAGAEKMRAIGGLAIITGHTQIITSGPRLDAVRAVADSVRSQSGWWLARADGVAEWWLDRSMVELQWASPSNVPSGQNLLSAGIPDVIVATSSETRRDDVWIDISAPQMSQSVMPFVDGVSVEFALEDWGMRLRVGMVEAGVTRRISFATVEPSTQDIAGTS